MYRKLTLKDKKKIVELREKEGLPYAAIAERFNISFSCIANTLTKARRARKYQQSSRS